MFKYSRRFGEGPDLMDPSPPSYTALITILAHSEFITNI